jgi:hypothetical protein
MAYTIFDSNANVSRLVRNGGNIKAAAIDLTVIPAANSSQSSPTNILVNAGDMLYATANNAIASLNTPGTTKANTAAFCGVAESGYPWRLRQGVYETEPDPTNFPPEVSYLTSGQFRFRTTVGDVYTTGAAVYMGADAQTVTMTSTSNGTLIGYVAADQRVLPGHPALGTSITGVAYNAGTPGAEIIIDIKTAVQF